MQIRVLGDINPSLTARLDSPARLGESEHIEGWEKLGDGQRDISDIPLRITDERYRLECDRLREDEARQAAVEELRITEIHDDARIADMQVNLGSVSKELTQEDRQGAASELVSNRRYVRQTQPTRRRNGAPWTLSLVLIITLAGVLGYGYLAMRRNGVSPWQLPGVQTAIMLHQHLDAAQSRASADVAAARQRTSQLVAAGRERWARWRR